MKPVLTLMALAIVVPELLTGSTPLSGFLNPGTLLVLFFGYGVAVLIIREIAVRNAVGYFGLFILGYAYSLLNEGLIAKTNLRLENLPIMQYDNYGFFFGLSVPWSLVIALFHTVCSVMFPILAAHVLFPEKKDVPWLSKKAASILGIVTLALASLIFFSPEGRIQGTLPIYIELVFLMIAIGLAALRFKKGNVPTASPQRSWKIFWLGISTFFFAFILLMSLADNKVSVPVFLLSYFVGVWFYIRTIREKFGVSDASLILFMLGVYFTVALQGLIFGVAVGEFQRLVSGAVALVLILWTSRRLIKNG